MFRPWAAHVPDDIDLCIVHLPGRETRWQEPPFVRLDELCVMLARTLSPALDRPFACFGHSLGALVAFELCRRLHASMRLSPRNLFVAAHRAPHLPNRLPRISRLPDADFVDAVGERHGPLPEAMATHRELMELMLPTLRADYQMAEDYPYVAAEPLPCPISVFGGADDRYVTKDELTSWRAQSSATCVYHAMTGGHFFVDDFRGAVVSAVLDDLSLR